MTPSKIVVGVVAVLAASAARAEVVTLACQFTTVKLLTNPSITSQVTFILDLDAATMGVREAPRPKVKISENMVSWIIPDGNRCLMGGINRITGEFGQQELKKTCQEVPAADFDGMVGERSDANVSEIWKGFCIPANKKIF